MKLGKALGLSISLAATLFGARRLQQRTAAFFSADGTPDHA